MTAGASTTERASPTAATPAPDVNNVVVTTDNELACTVVFEIAPTDGDPLFVGVVNDLLGVVGTGDPVEFDAETGARLPIDALGVVVAGDTAVVSGGGLVLGRCALSAAMPNGAATGSPTASTPAP